MPDTMQKVRLRRGGSPPWSTDVVGVGAAVICAMFTWFCTTQLAGVQLTVDRGDDVQRIGGGAVALVAGAGALVGFAVLRLLERVTTRALGIWTTLAVVVTLVSLLGPLAATSTAAVGALMSLHTVVAAVVIAVAQTTRRNRRAPN